MPTTLILRRTFPRPVTFADLRRAALDGLWPPMWTEPFARAANGRGWSVHEGRACVVTVRQWWHASIKEVTRAHDDVYAVIDGQELHVTRVDGPGYEMRERKVPGVTGAMVHDLLEKADDAGYWANPHEVRLTVASTDGAAAG